MSQPTDLESVVGDAIDTLLDHCNGGTLRDSPIYKLRLSIRKGRPDSIYVWNDDCQAQFESLLAKSESLALLREIEEILKGASPLKILGRHGYRASHREDDFYLELDAFHDAPLLDAVASRLRDDLNNEDLIGKILRGHLWLEYGLEQLLERRVQVYPDLQKAKLTFFQKVHVARSMALLQDDEQDVILHLNTIRNRMAHRFDYVLDAEAETVLIGKCSERLLTIAGVRGSTTFPDGFVLIFATLVVILYRTADELDARRRYEDWMHARVLKATGRI